MKKANGRTISVTRYAVAHDGNGIVKRAVKYTLTGKVIFRAFDSLIEVVREGVGYTCWIPGDSYGNPTGA